MQLFDQNLEPRRPRPRRIDGGPIEKFIDWLAEWPERRAKRQERLERERHRREVVRLEREAELAKLRRRLAAEKAETDVANAAPGTAPCPMTKVDAAAIEIEALRRELGRLPELHEIVARTDVPKTTAWRALKRVAAGA